MENVWCGYGSWVLRSVTGVELEVTGDLVVMSETGVLIVRELDDEGAKILVGMNLGALESWVRLDDEETVNE